MSIESLKAMVKKLLVEIEQLKAKNAELKAENAELRSRLDKNSGNSNKPPSTDGLTKKPALPKPKTSNNGGQKGHKGNTLRPVPEPDHIVCHYPEICSCCGKIFHKKQIDVISKRQVFDLPPQKLTVTEHQLGQAVCNCGHIETGTYPSHITQPAQYGARVKELGVLLSVHYRLPQEQICPLFDRSLRLFTEYGNRDSCVGYRVYSASTHRSTDQKSTPTRKSCSL